MNKVIFEMFIHLIGYCKYMLLYFVEKIYYKIFENLSLSLYVTLQLKKLESEEKNIILIRSHPKFCLRSRLLMSHGAILRVLLKTVSTK